MLSNEDQKFIMTGYGMITYFPDSKVWTITSDLGGSYFISYNNIASMYDDVKMLMWDRVRKISRSKKRAKR